MEGETSTMQRWLWVALALVLLVFRWWWFAEPSTSSPSPLTIEARGEKRAWHFRYPGDDGLLGNADDRTSTGVLTLPKGAEIVLQLRSRDYIYVFSCPDLALKEIAVPDLEYALQFTASETGTHELVMDPMCGFRLPPGQSMGTLEIVRPKSFLRWMKALPLAP